MKRFALLLPLLVLASLLLPSAPASASTYATEILRLTNVERAKHHLPALRPSFCLNNFASPWASHLAAQRRLAHQSLSPIMTRCHGRSAGENVAKGNVTPARMVQMWMASPGHRANILNRYYTHLGTGAVRGSDRAVYGVQDFVRV